MIRVLGSVRATLELGKSGAGDLAYSIGLYEVSAARENQYALISDRKSRVMGYREVGSTTDPRPPYKLSGPLGAPIDVQAHGSAADLALSRPRLDNAPRPARGCRRSRRSPAARVRTDPGGRQTAVG